MPAILDQPTQLESAKKRGQRFGHPMVARAVRLVLLLSVSAGIAGGWYLARKGFGRQWRSRMVEELHKRGVEASIRRLTLDPFRGLVARDVRIFDYRNREKTLAIVTEIALDLNYAALFHRQPFLNAIDIQNAQITLPLNDAESIEKIRQPLLKNFRAHVYFPPERIYLSQAEGDLCGIHVSATGELIKRADYKPSSELSQEDWQKRLSLVRQIVAELQKFSTARVPPVLQVKFSGDLGQMEEGQVEATLQAEQLRRGNYEARDLFAAAEWRNQTLTITRCEWKDDLGKFAGRGEWSRERETGKLQAHSTLDLKKLVESAGWSNRLDDIAFVSAPEIDLQGEGDFSQRQPRLKLIGHMRVDQLRYKSVPFSDCGLEFSWDGERIFLDNIHARQNRGELHAKLLDAPNDFRLNIDSNINPVIARPFVSPEMNRFLNDWDFAEGAALRLAIRGLDRRPEHWQGDGDIALGRTRFRGSWMKNASAKVHFANGAVAYQDLRVTRDEGVATGSFVYDFANHEVRVANIRSSLRPTDVAVWIDSDLPKTVAPYRFRQPPAITANGVYQFRGGKNTRLEILVDGQKGMDYTFLGKVLPFDRIAGKLIFTEDRLQIVDLVASLFSGQVLGTTDISLARNDPRYHAGIQVKAINFPRLTELYYNYRAAQGNLSGVYDFEGFGSDARKMQGSGKVEVTDGDVFAIPVFGPLSGILGHIMPGTGYSVARTATASFTIKDGIIHTDDLVIAGKLFSMLGGGDIHFLDDKLDFDLRIDPKGPGVLLAPVYKLFEYKGEGSLKNPDWHPKRF